MVHGVSADGIRYDKPNQKRGRHAANILVKGEPLVTFNGHVGGWWKVWPANRRRSVSRFMKEINGGESKCRSLITG